MKEGIQDLLVEDMQIRGAPLGSKGMLLLDWWGYIPIVPW